MNRETGNRSDTEQRLLEAAGDLFAEKGFTATTNRDICARAGVNIAAVNYYFGSKEKLYAEAWRKAFNDSLKKHPPDGGVPPDAPAADRLHGRIRAMVHKIADRDNQAFRIANTEMTAPTRLLKEVKKECIRPLQKEMEKVLRELMGEGTPEKHIQFCLASIQGQCFGILRHVRMYRDQKDLPPSFGYIINDIDGYADHVFHFSMGGIRGISSSHQGSNPNADTEGPNSQNSLALPGFDDK